MCFVNIYIYNITSQNTDFGLLQRERGGGGVVLWIIKGTLLFLIQNNLSLLFLRNINWGSYEKIIRIYFLYEISLRKYRKYMWKMLFNY